MEKIKNWLTKNWLKAITVTVIVCFILIMCTITGTLLVSEKEVQEWFKKPLYNLTVSDIFILLALHACMCRFLKKENKCNCK